ncbi:MAG: hypothetical protein R3B48_11545 [Kofleriaceae bacterium]
MRVMRLTALLTCLGLVISRAGLLLHELVGHGGAALACGGQVGERRFFWFAGGWIRTSTPGGSELTRLVVELGGIAAELVVGGALLAWARGRGARGGRARLAGLLLLAHGLWYAATGTWHGFGDGTGLHRLLGSARYAVALALGAALCAVAALGARALARAFAPHVAGATPRRLALVLVAAAAAAATHGALTFGEVALRRDVTYARTMQTADQRVAAERLARWRAEAARRGQPVTAAGAAAAERALRPPRGFPFAWALAIAALAATLVGGWSLRRAALARDATTTTPLPAAELARAAAAAALAVAAVAILSA